MGNLLDRLAVADAHDELADIAGHHALKGFTHLHAAVGTSDLSHEAASFWFLDTREIIAFFVLICTYGAVYTIQAVSYLAHMRWGYFPRQPSASVLEARLALVHLGAVCAGWACLLGICVLVGWRQWWDASQDDVSSMPQLVRRRAPSVWCPLPRRHGIWRHAITETRPQPWRFVAPISSVGDGNALYSHDELVDELVFGTSVNPQLRAQRREWKARLRAWYPPTLGDAIDWLMARRAIFEDRWGTIARPTPVPGRFFVDYDEEPGPADPMRGKELRRYVWMIMWLPCGAAAICEIIRAWLAVVPPTGLGWVATVVSVLSALFIMWFQGSTFGAKMVERYDREQDDTENVFSRSCARS